MILPFNFSLLLSNIRLSFGEFVAAVGSQWYYIYYFRFPLNLENGQQKKLLHIPYRVVNEGKINIMLQAFIIISEVRTIS